MYYSQQFSKLGIFIPVQDKENVASIQFSHSVMSDSLQPHGLQHTRPPCPSPTPGVAKFRLQLKKVGETTRPFRYDVNAVTKE